ncbi:Uncharacterized protein HZ326_1758 [Fusarium oxysporum f. sp. albedinis]|nr:Uncharacterized protein HZ326_1758 [Fusarium oxysporum f. sp. albedinis]
MSIASHPAPLHPNSHARLAKRFPWEEWCSASIPIGSEPRNAIMSATVDEPNSNFGVERGNYVGEELQHILFRARFPTTFKDDSGVLEDR